MPDRRYHPTRQPPSVLDRFAAHHDTVILSAWWVVMGLGVVLTSVFDLPVTSAFVRMSDEIGIATGAAITASGGAVGWATLTRTDRTSLVWDVQQSGLILGVAAWATYAGMVISLDPWNWVSIGHGTTMTVVSGVGFVVSKLSERAGRDDVRADGGAA